MWSPFRMHEFAHCDGLVLLASSEAVVRVLNPATRHVRALPWGSGSRQPRQAFGLGHDPRSHAYKVARCFVTGGNNYKTGMEVFTIGTDQRWRETTTPPPYPVVARRTATFFKGSLIWTIDESILGLPAPGFLRFRLDDEAFVLMDPPPCDPRLDYAVSALADLRGELCLACGGADMMTMDMWMCDNMENPQWDRRYKIVSEHMPPDFNPIAAFGDQIVFKERNLHTGYYDLKNKTYKDVFWMKDLRKKDCKRAPVERDENGCRIRAPRQNQHPVVQPAAAPPPRPQAWFPPAAPPPQVQAQPAAARPPRTQAWLPPAAPPPQVQAHPAGAAMPRAGHPDTRPDESSVFISGTDDMQRLASLLSTNAVVAWIDSLVEGVSISSVQHSIAQACNALNGDVTVVKHHPEQFLVTFTHMHHAIDAIGRGSLPVGRYNLQLRQWRLEAHADHVDMNFHVRVGLENVPLHAWNEHTVSRIIGRASSLDYIEPRSLRKEDT
ncbi:hypothetical protein ACQ4PT_034176 [Festuca glaucescens]